MSALFSYKSCIGLSVYPKQLSLDTRTEAKIALFDDVVLRLTIPCHRHTAGSLSLAAVQATMLALKSISHQDNRTCLLIAGQFLEDEITVFSLEALVEGFDVHLLSDVIVAREVLAARVSELRLFQAGVVPTSLRQLLYQWLVVEEQQLALETLSELIQQYENFTKAS
jgi:hypothetical protein